MSNKLIIANWKENIQSLAQAQEILESVDQYLSTSEKNLDLVICPPASLIEDISKILKTSSLAKYTTIGAQDINLDNESILQRVGVRYVIVGHSDRRWKAGESDEIVNQKLKTVLQNGMTPVVCLGEKERNENYKEFLKEQTEKTFAGLSEEEISKCLIAYEPVWAISTSANAQPDTPESALESIRTIKEVLKQDLKYLYGGSVNSTNAEAFLSQSEISGVLVGSASLKKDEFIKILSLV